MSTKHTQGPWQVIIDYDRNIKVYQDRPRLNEDDIEDDIHIATLRSATTRRYYPLHDEAIANAHLIAAAPMLYEVLKEIINDGVHCDVVPYLHRKAVEALAKAGEQA